MRLKMYDEIVSGGWFGLGGALLLILIAILMFLARNKKATIVTSVAAVLQLISALLTLTDNANFVAMIVNILVTAVTFGLLLNKQMDWKRFGMWFVIVALANTANGFQIAYQMTHGDGVWNVLLSLFEILTGLAAVGFSQYALSTHTSK